MPTYAAGSRFRLLLSTGCIAALIAASSAHAQLTASAESLGAAREDSARAGDQRLMQSLQRIMDLDSALAMSALPRLRLDATRDLARATVLNQRATGDSLRVGTSGIRSPATWDAQYRSRLEDEARRLLRTQNANVDLSYVNNALRLQGAALRVIDKQLTDALQSDAARIHVAAARLYTLERLKYAEELRRELSGQRVSRR